MPFQIFKLQSKYLVFKALALLSVLLLASTISVQAKELKAGLGDLDYPPFYFEKDGVIQGAAVEIAQHISEKLGHKLTFTRFPWRRVQATLKHGHIDMVILYFRTSEREKHVVYTSLPHINETSYLIVAKGKNVNFEGRLKTLKSLSFGNVKGYSHGQEYDSADYLSKFEVRNEINLIKMLVKGRIDVAVGNKPTIMHYAKSENLQSEISFIKPALEIGENYFAFTRSRNDAQKLADEFSAELKLFKNTDAYRNILKKYNFSYSPAPIDETRTIN